jgi:hypothetical protein
MCSRVSGRCGPPLLMQFVFLLYSPGTLGVSIFQPCERESLVGVYLYRWCETIVFHSWKQYIESMCVLYIDIVIASMDLAIIRYLP